MKIFRLTLFLALRNLGRHWSRTLSTLAAIGIGLVGLAFLDGYITYSMWGLKETIIHSGSGHIQLALSSAYFDEGDDPFPYLMKDPKALVKELRRMPEVKDVVPSLGFVAVLETGGKLETVQVKAMPTAQRQANLDFLRIKTGTDLEPGLHGRVLVGSGLASKLGLVPGSSVTLFALGPEGSVSNQVFTVAGLASSGITAIDATSAYLDLSDAQSLLGTASVPLLTVFLDHTEDTDALLTRLKTQPPRAADPGTVFRGWEELSPSFQRANGSYQMVLGVARFIVLLVALFSISGTLNLSVLERFREIGTLRAMGNRRFQVIALLQTEGGVLGLAGGLAGTVLGWILTQAFNGAGGLTMPAQPGMTDPLTIFFTPDPGHALANGLWVIAASAAGAWFPAYFATRKNPAALLQSV